MNLTKITGAILIVISLGVGYLGLNKVADSTKTVNILGLRIEASSESGKEEGYLYVGLAIVLFAGGIIIANKPKV